MNSSDNQLTAGLIEVKKSSKDANAFPQDWIYINELFQTSLDSSNLSDPVDESVVVDDVSNFSVSASKINPYYIPDSAEEVVSDPDVVVDPSPVGKNGTIDENLINPVCIINPVYH